MMRRVRNHGLGGEQVGDVRFAVALAAVEGEPIFEPREVEIAVEPADVKGIASRQVVRPEGAAEPLKAGLADGVDDRLGDVPWEAAGHGEVANGASDQVFQFPFRGDDFATDLAGVSDA